MNHTLLYYFLFLLFSINSRGQENLILNGDFEEFWQCPNSSAQVNNCKYVFNPCESNLSFSTSDYFNSCYSTSSGIPVGVPNNFVDFQYPYSGNGMLGMVMKSYDTLLKTYFCEYIQLSICNELECGANYTFSIMMNLNNSSRHTVKNFGFYFSEERIIENDFLFNQFSPQYIDSFSIIDDTLNWEKITFNFIADKPYKFITIGAFKKDSLESFVDVNSSATNQLFSSYFFIDYASLFLLNLMSIPNVFTPNGDGVNDLFEIEGDTKGIDNIIFLNRWGNVVNSIESPFIWDGKDKGQNELINGEYFYILSQNKGCGLKQGMVHLIR